MFWCQLTVVRVHKTITDLSITAKALRLWKAYKTLLAAGLPTFRATIIPATCGNAFSDYLYAIRLGYKTMFSLADSFSEWDAKSEKMLEIAYKNIAQHFTAHWKRYRKNPIKLSLLERSMKQYLQDMENISQGRATQRVPTSARSKCGLGQSAGGYIPDGRHLRLPRDDKQ